MNKENLLLILFPITLIPKLTNDEKILQLNVYSKIAKNARNEILPEPKEEVKIIKKMFKVYGNKKTVDLYFKK